MDGLQEIDHDASKASSTHRLPRFAGTGERFRQNLNSHGPGEVGHVTDQPLIKGL